MAFDDIKTHNGQKYSGMAVGSAHLWNYLNAVWEETKVRSDLWKIKFTSVKHRAVSAPEGSGVPLGTRYHWLIVADQVVKKTTANTYETEMIGYKYKLGHQRPYWRAFSYTYPRQKSLRERRMETLREELLKLEAEETKEQSARLEKELLNQ